MLAAIWYVRIIVIGTVKLCKRCTKYIPIPLIYPLPVLVALCLTMLPGQRPFLIGPQSPPPLPYPTSHSHAMARADRKSCIPTKQMLAVSQIFKKITVIFYIEALW